MNRFFASKFRLVKKLVALLMLACFLSLPVKPASAGTATGTITVTATVLTACLLVTLPLPFGNYDPTASSATTASTTITATCTLSAPYTISLNNGSGSGANATAGSTGRKMTVSLGTAELGYNLYQDSAYTTLWGTSSQELTSTGTGLVQTFTVYGRIPAQQTASSGIYSDTVTATLAF